MIFSSDYEKIAVIIRIAVVYVIMGLFFLIDCVAFPSPFRAIMYIPFLTIMVFYWALYRPTVLNSVMIFIAGLLFDILTGLPLGISAAVLIIMNYSLLAQRAFLLLQPFWIVWGIFIITQAVITLLQWGVGGLIHMQWMPVLTMMPAIIMSVIAFPCLVVVLHLIHKILPEHHLTLTSR